MPRDPGSAWAPLPEAGAPDGYVKTQFIVHSTGDNGTAAATHRYFAGPTVNESTFIVGWGPEDPTLQIMDSTDNADANGSANQRGISVEVVGDGTGGYNAWQRKELIRLGWWARANHPGILPRVIPSEPAAGFGWHVMFGAPGPWAKVAKSCPGNQRIAELKADIFPAIFAGTDEEDEMDAGQIAALDQARNNAIAANVQAGETRRMLGVLFGYNNPANETERAALVKLYGEGNVPDVDEGAIIAGLAPMVASRLDQLSDEDVERIAEAAAAKIGMKLVSAS